MVEAISIFLHKGPFARRVRQCVADMAAIGLVGESIWIDAEDGSYGTLIGHGNAPEHNHLSRLLNNVGGAPVHLVALNVVGQDGGAGVLEQDEIQRLQSEIRNTGVGYVAGAASTNVIVAEVGASVDKQFPLVAGFSNLLLAPEESESPDIPASTVFRADSNDPEELALSVACKVAGLCGLWQGAQHIPVVQLGADNGIRLVRTFYRRVDAQEIQKLLKARLFDVAQLPKVSLTPGGNQVHVTTINNQAATNEQIAAEVIAHNAENIEAPREEARKQATQNMQALAVIKKMGALYAQNLVRWPGIFFSNVSSGFKHLVENQVQGMLGEDSSIRVSDLESMPKERPQGRQPSRDLDFNRELYRPMWEEYIDTSLALADANPRRLVKDGGQPPYYLQSSSGGAATARSASDIIPGPSAAFTVEQLPPGLRSTADELPLQPYDVKGIRGFRARLGAANSRGVDETLQRFDAWERKHANSLAARLGNQLDWNERRLWDDYLTARRDYEDALARSRKVPNGNGGAGIWRWLGYVVFWSGAIFALAWGIGNWTAEQTPAGRLITWGWVQNLNNASGKTIFWMFFIWFLLWLICWLIQVWLFTKQIFQAATTRREILSEERAAKINMEAAWQAYLNIQHAYLQFLSISRIYGALLERPFGTVANAETKSPVPMNQMPASVLISTAEPDEAAINKFADDIRGEYYRQGWLDERVDVGLKRAFDMVQMGHGDQGGDKHSYLRSRGQGTGEILDLLAQAVSSPQFMGEDRTGNKWDQVVARLERNEGGKRDELLAKQKHYSGGMLTSAREMPSLGAVKNSGMFNGEFITEGGWAGGTANNVDQALTDHSATRQSGDQVGAAELLVQYGRPGTRDSFVLRGNEGQALGGGSSVQLPGLD